MKPLDELTAVRIAEVVVDIGGPYERTGRALEALLARSGWVDPPDYDGSPRVPWLTEQLVERRDQTHEIERLLCRVCDPIEYDDGMDSADEFRTVLNAKLAAEEIVVSRVGMRPVVGTATANGAVYSEPDDLDRRLRNLIVDSGSVDLLMRRVHEARLCEDSGAYTMAIIGIGSFVEGVLHSLLTERDNHIRDHGFVGRDGRKFKADRAGLELLIDVAHEKGWIQLDAKDFMHNVRQYRNFVHPRAELEKQPKFDQDSVTLCWAPVRALLNDLEEHIEPVPAGP